MLAPVNMGLRGLLRFSSNAGRTLGSRAAGNESNVLVKGFCSSGFEFIESHRVSSMKGISVLDYARYFSSAETRSASSNLRDTTLSHLVSAAARSTLSFPSASLFPSSARSFADERFRVGGLLVQQLSPSSMQQKRGISKLKKYKIKAYSSYKERFKLMADGTYKRWRSGTRHNAHSKTAKQRRQLRRPSIAPLALAKVMKKLNFMG